MVWYRLESVNRRYLRSSSLRRSVQERCHVSAEEPGTNLKFVLGRAAGRPPQKGNG